MYLSRIKLNTSLRKTMQALAAPNLFHGAIESAESGERTRKLWRIDDLYDDKYLLILSNDPIDFSAVAEQFGYGTEYECKSYDRLLDRIENGSIWHFRLKSNPTIQSKKSTSSNGRGKVFAHKTTSYQEEWLRKKAECNGFSLIDGEWSVTGSKWYVFKKNRSQKSQVKMLSVTYEGLLTVTDTELFKNALTKGIGREKAFGMGLITIAGAKI